MESTVGAEEHVMHFLVMDLNKTACNNQSDTLKDLLETKSPNMFPFLRGHMTDLVSILANQSWNVVQCFFLFWWKDWVLGAALCIKKK